VDARGPSRPSAARTASPIQTSARLNVPASRSSTGARAPTAASPPATPTAIAPGRSRAAARGRVDRERIQQRRRLLSSSATLRAPSPPAAASTTSAPSERGPAVRAAALRVGRPGALPERAPAGKGEPAGRVAAPAVLVKASRVLGRPSREPAVTAWSVATPRWWPRGRRRCRRLAPAPPPVPGDEGSHEPILGQDQVNVE